MYVRPRTECEYLPLEFSVFSDNFSPRFLHAELQIKAMELYHEKEEFSKALQNVPEKLESMYQLILNLVDQQPPSAASRARSALLYIISAQRRLYFDELQYALATCPNTHQFDPKRLLAEETLLTFCCGLVTLDGAPDTRQSVRLFRKCSCTAKHEYH